jgi:hypothetical protein
MVMQRFSSEVARSLCVDPSMVVLPMLSIAGASIGNTARARMSADYDAPPNIWSVVVVRSGERKSPVLRAVMQPIYARQHEVAEQYAQALAEHESEMQRWKSLLPKERRATDRPVEPGAYPHLYLSDTTTEAIATRLLVQPRGLPAVLDELAGFFSGMNQYRAKGGNDRESYLAFYDAGAAKIDRKSAMPPTIFIPRAFVAVTGMLQPGALARALGPAEFDSGLAARFVLASPPPQKATWQDFEVPNEVRDSWRDLLHALLNTPLPEHPVLIPPSDVAKSLWARAHDRLEAERHSESDDRMRAARAKLIGLIPRLALIIQCVSAASGEQNATIRSIDETSMTRAVELAEWFTRETGRVYGLLAEDGDDNDIIDRIESNGGIITPRELARRCYALRSRGSAEAYLNELVRDAIGKWGYAHQGSAGGRPSRVFILNRFRDGGDTSPADVKNEGNGTVTAWPDDAIVEVQAELDAEMDRTKREAIGESAWY